MAKKKFKKPELVNRAREWWSDHKDAVWEGMTTFVISYGVTSLVVDFSPIRGWMAKPALDRAYTKGFIDGQKDGAALVSKALK